MYSSMLYDVCACRYDYVHREINLGTSTFATDPMCACVWGATKRGGTAIRDLTGELFESAKLRGSDSAHDWWCFYVCVCVCVCA